MLLDHKISPSCLQTGSERVGDKRVCIVSRSKSTSLALALSAPNSMASRHELMMMMDDLHSTDQIAAQEDKSHFTIHLTLLLLSSTLSSNEAYCQPYWPLYHHLSSVSLGQKKTQATSILCLLFWIFKGQEKKLVK